MANNATSPMTPGKRKGPRLVDEASLPVTPQSEPITPHKVRSDIDRHIDRLNGTWNLGLPIIRGAAASQMESSKALAKKLSARIRYLSFRAHSLDSLIDDFEERARLIYSSWKFKPNMQPGVILVRNASEQNLEGAAMKRKRHSLSERQIDQLLRCFDGVLKDPYQLSRQSDSFTLTAAPASPTAQILPISKHFRQTKAVSNSSSAAALFDPLSKKSPIMGPKRPSDDVGAMRGNKKTKTHENDGPMLRWVQRRTSLPPVQTSFDSVDSPAASPVFSSGGDAPDTSSADTSIAEGNDFSATQDGEISELIALADTMTKADTSPLANRLQSTFDDPELRAPAYIDLDYAYELESHALSLRTSAQKLWETVRDQCGTDQPSTEARTKAYTIIADGKPIENFSARSWDPSQDLPDEKKLHRSFYQTMTLKWDSNRSATQSPFSVTIHKPTADKSCRFHRIYGGHRYMVARVPYLRQKDLKDHESAVELNMQISDWLYSGSIRVGLRYWQAFWVDDKDLVLDKVNYKDVHMFAVSGRGLESISLNDFCESYAPWESNMNSTDCKLFARFKLGLSKTTPTVVLEQDEFLVTNDMLAPDGKTVMNDGCSLISSDLAHEIARMLELDETPSAFQGRIGGSKGLFLADHRDTHIHDLHGRNFWIQITPSQLKIEPHPRYRQADESCRTFEVTRVSNSLQTSALNFQLLNVLHNRGVSREIIAERLKAVSIQYYEELCKGLEAQDPLLLRGWLQKYHSFGYHRSARMLYVGSRPVSKDDLIKIMLDVGFSPKDCGYLFELFTETIKTHLKEYVQRMRIRLPKSTFAYMVPDPHGVLEEGEIQLSVSQEGLVARNPANLPSDVQKVTFVQRQALEPYRNVVFFSTKGDRPLADRLSGGDYDGGQAWVCWDTDIVQSFQNFEGVPIDGVEPEHVSLERCATTLSAIFPDGLVTEKTRKTYFMNNMVFNMRPSLLGQVTNEHVKDVYNLSLRTGQRGAQALQAHGPVRLAALASFLVDARKQGYRLSGTMWEDLRKTLCSKGPRLAPAFQEDEENMRGSPNFNKSNINDFLKFMIAHVEKERVIAAWHKLPRSNRKDEALTKASEAYQVQGRAEDTATGPSVITTIFQKLRIELDTLVEEWKVRVSKKMTGPENDVRMHLRAIRDLHEKYRAIEPYRVPGQESHYFYRFHELAVSAGHSNWADLRASFAYSHLFSRSRPFVWSMCAEELCRMKILNGKERMICQQDSVYTVMKLDSRALRRVEGKLTKVQEELQLMEEAEEETQYFDAISQMPDGTVDYYLR